MNELTARLGRPTDQLIKQ